MREVKNPVPPVEISPATRYTESDPKDIKEAYP